MRLSLLLCLALASCADLGPRPLVLGTESVAPPYGWVEHCAEEMAAQRAAPECGTKP